MKIRLKRLSVNKLIFVLEFIREMT